MVYLNASGNPVIPEQAVPVVMTVDFDGLEHGWHGGGREDRLGRHCLVGKRLEDTGVDIDRSDDEFGRFPTTEIRNVVEVDVSFERFPDLVFARLELAMALATMVDRVALDISVDGELSFVPSISLRPENDVTATVHRL